MWGAAAVSPDPERTDASLGSWIDGGGEMGELIRRKDWSLTALGSLDSWPQSLRTALSIVVNSRYPMFLFWGPNAICLYNDGYRPSLGAHKHPQALGQEGRACWAEIWEIIGPQIEAVTTRAEATWFEDQLVPFDRNGYLEEIYFTYSYSPVRDESGSVGGTLVVCAETTERVLIERRLRTLSALSARASTGRDVVATFRTAFETLAENPHDVAFALVYEVDALAGRARLIEATGLEQGGAASPALLALDGADGWPVATALERDRPEHVVDLAARFGALPGGAWPETAREALVLPMALAGRDRPDYALVFGVSPRKALDPGYRNFFELLRNQIASSAGEASARAADLHRAEAQQKLSQLRLEAEARARRSEARLQLALEAGRSGSWEYDPVTREVLYDGAYGPLLGRPTGPGRITGALLESYVPERERAAGREAVLRAVAAGSGAEFEAEYRLCVPSQPERWVASRGRVVAAADGGVRLVGTLVDVTERRRAEEQLRSVNEAQGRFVSDASHELRGPLTSILGNLELVTRHPEMSAEDRTAALGDARTEAGRMARLVNDLMEVVRGERRGLDRAPVRLEAVLQGAWQTAQASSNRHRFELGQLEPAVVEGNADELTRLASILLENAIKYTPAGATVRLEAHIEGSWAEFSVSDSGPGIAPEDLPFVFERFYRADRARARGLDSSGSGLGLAIAARIVERHGGRISASSAPESGAIFAVHLPIAPDSSG